ncbi:MAG: LacI family DNA-binding transcriptional regulator [Acidimicrobiales bacterium]
MAESVTLDDVARISGVSPAAASRALNGRDGVRPEIRDRVLLVAESLGYRPNRAARNLASGRSSIIGLVLPSQELKLDPYGASVIQAIAHAANDLDQGLMLVLGNDQPGVTVRHILRDGILDGVIISSVALGESWVEEIIESPIASLVVGTQLDRPGLHVVDVENRESSAAAVTHLLESGRRRIATITGPLDRHDASDRLAGYRLAHQRAGVPVDETLIVSGEFSRRSGSLSTGLLLDRAGEHPPDAIFAANDETAVGAMRVLHERGLRIPDDVAVVGFDGTSAVDDVEPTLTSVHQPFAEMGQVAVAHLLALLDGGEVPSVHLLEPTLVIGHSSCTDP